MVRVCGRHPLAFAENHLLTILRVNPPVIGTARIVSILKVRIRAFLVSRGFRNPLCHRRALGVALQAHVPVTKGYCPFHPYRNAGASSVAPLPLTLYRKPGFTAGSVAVAQASRTAKTRLRAARDSSVMGCPSKASQCSRTAAASASPSPQTYTPSALSLETAAPNSFRMCDTCTARVLSPHPVAARKSFSETPPVRMSPLRARIAAASSMLNVGGRPRGSSLLTGAAFCALPFACSEAMLPSSASSSLAEETETLPVLFSLLM